MNCLEFYVRQSYEFALNIFQCIFCLLLQSHRKPIRHTLWAIFKIFICSSYIVQTSFGTILDRLCSELKLSFRIKSVNLLNKWAKRLVYESQWVLKYTRKWQRWASKWYNRWNIRPRWIYLLQTLSHFLCIYCPWMADKHLQLFESVREWNQP